METGSIVPTSSQSLTMFLGRFATRASVAACPTLTCRTFNDVGRESNPQAVSYIGDVMENSHRPFGSLSSFLSNAPTSKLMRFSELGSVARSWLKQWLFM